MSFVLSFVTHGTYVKNEMKISKWSYWMPVIFRRLRKWALLYVISIFLSVFSLIFVRGLQGLVAEVMNVISISLSIGSPDGPYRKTAVQLYVTNWVDYPWGTQGRRPTKYDVCVCVCSCASVFVCVSVYVVFFILSTIGNNGKHRLPNSVLQTTLHANFFVTVTTVFVFTCSFSWIKQ